jgi:hypothetical protein
VPDNSKRRVRELLAEHGTTYAEEAGIKLADKPGPLYQLLVLATLLSARISADIAVAAARELFGAGYRSPAAMTKASWQDRVDALGRGHYRRYDERTATMLGNGAEQLLRDWRGDLRMLRTRGAGTPRPSRACSRSFPASGRPGPASSCARCRRPGPRSHRTWTTVSSGVPARRGCRPAGKTSSNCSTAAVSRPGWRPP